MLQLDLHQQQSQMYSCNRAHTLQQGLQHDLKSAMVYECAIFSVATLQASMLGELHIAAHPQQVSTGG